MALLVRVAQVCFSGAAVVGANVSGDADAAAAAGDDDALSRNHCGRC